MSNSFRVECPDCGTAATVSFSPTVRLSFEASVTIDRVDCGWCGYAGPPEDDDG